MYSYQAVIPALHMEGDADEQCYDPGQHRGLAQSPLQKREQQVQKQDAAEEPLAYTGESIPTQPAATAKLSNPKKVSTSVMVLAPV